MCLIPPATEPNPNPEEPQEPAPADPVKSWSLLSHLMGNCLYVSPCFVASPFVIFFSQFVSACKHRQGWFTYSYCHNLHVRQFKERDHVHPHPPGKST